MKLVCLTLLLALSCSVHASNLVEESRKLIAREVIQYKDNGPKGFLAAATKNGPSMSEKSARDILEGLAEIEATCGKPVDHSIKRIDQLSDNVVSALFIINLAKCPVFFRQTIYRTKSGEVVTSNFNLHMQPEAVWPNNVVFPH